MHSPAKSFIALSILISMLLVYACGASQRIRNRVQPGMTYSEFDRIAEQEGHKNIGCIEFKGYKLYRWYKLGFSTTYAIFDPDYKLVKYVGHNSGCYAIKGRIKYLRNFVTSYTGEKDYSDVARFDPYLANALEAYDNDKELLNERYERYTYYSEQLSLIASKCQQDEADYLKTLSDEQLEYFSKYEEAIKEGSASKKELYSRKIINSLSPEKIDELKILNQQFNELEIGKEYSIKEYNDIQNEMEKLNKRKEAIREYIRMQLVRLNPRASSVNVWQTFSNDLQRMADDMRQRSYQHNQQFMMYQINDSLRDISNAIRGY